MILAQNWPKQQNPHDTARLSRPELPDDFAQAQTYEWFNTYISENPKSDSFPGGCRLKALLHFSTWYQVPPPGESLPQKVSISFLPDDDQHQLPIAQSMFWLFEATNSSFFYGQVCWVYGHGPQVWRHWVCNVLTTSLEGATHPGTWLVTVWCNTHFCIALAPLALGF